jgi:hypothetical protein
LGASLFASSSPSLPSGFSSGFFSGLSASVAGFIAAAGSGVFPSSSLGSLTISFPSSYSSTSLTFSLPSIAMYYSSAKLYLDIDKQKCFDEFIAKPTKELITKLEELRK